MYLCMLSRLFARFFGVYFSLPRALFSPVLTCQNKLSDYRYSLSVGLMPRGIVKIATPWIVFERFVNVRV